MFKKFGDNMPVMGYTDTEDEILCPKCERPMTVIAIEENDNLELVCQCEQPEILECIDERNIS